MFGLYMLTIINETRHYTDKVTALRSMDEEIITCFVLL